MLFTDIITVYAENHINPINTNLQHYRLLRQLEHTITTSL
jgi:hypothetical protein